MPKRGPQPPRSDKRPEQQTDESEGPIKSRQVTDAQMRDKDLPRGSEPETRAASSRR